MTGIVSRRKIECLSLERIDTIFRRFEQWSLVFEMIPLTEKDESLLVNTKFAGCHWRFDRPFRWHVPGACELEIVFRTRWSKAHHSGCRSGNGRRRFQENRWTLNYIFRWFAFGGVRRKSLLSAFLGQHLRSTTPGGGGGHIRIRVGARTADTAPYIPPEYLYGNLFKKFTAQMFILSGPIALAHLLPLDYLFAEICTRTITNWTYIYT